jgi:hypothetical protein
VAGSSAIDAEEPGVASSAGAEAPPGGRGRPDAGRDEAGRLARAVVVRVSAELEGAVAGGGLVAAGVDEFAPSAVTALGSAVLPPPHDASASVSASDATMQTRAGGVFRATRPAYTEKRCVSDRTVG